MDYVALLSFRSSVPAAERDAERDGERDGEREAERDEREVEPNGTNGNDHKGKYLLALPLRSFTQ